MKGRIETLAFIGQLLAPIQVLARYSEGCEPVKQATGFAILKTLELLKQPSPFFLCRLEQRRGGFRYRRKIVRLQPVPGPASVDDGAAVPAAFTLLFGGRDHWIQRVTPAMPQNIDVRRWIGARADGPDDILTIRRVDIIVDYDGIAVHQPARLALHRNSCRLCRVAGVLLLNARYHPHAAGTGLRDPHALHSWYSGFAQRPFDYGGAEDTGEIGIIVQGPARGGAKYDGIIAVVKCFNANESVRFFATGVVAGELAKRTFLLHISLGNKSLDRNLRIRRNRQTGDWTANHGDALSRNRTNPGKFIDSGRDFQSAHQEEKRMRAKDDHNRTGLIFVPIFLPYDITVMSRRNVCANGILALPLDAVGSYINPTGYRILVDVQTAGPYIRTAIQFMP